MMATASSPISPIARGIGGPSLTHLAWGADFADLDSDGWIDLFVATGHLEKNVQLLNPTITYPQQNQLFLNRGGRTFDDVSDSSGDGIAAEKGKPRRGFWRL